MNIDGIEIDVRRSVRTKSLRLYVYPHCTTVRLTAPVYVGMSEIKAFATSKINWIKKVQAKLGTASKPKRQYKDGETLVVFGVQKNLTVTESVRNRFYMDDSTVSLYISDTDSYEVRKRTVENALKKQLLNVLENFISSWAETIGVQVKEYKIRAMKSRWGSCRFNKGSVTFNFFLYKKPLPAIEYVVVHELLHFIVTNHGPEFKRLMRFYLPDWKVRQEMLKDDSLDKYSDL